MGAGSSLGQGWPDCEYYSDHSGVVGAEGGGNRHWVGKEVSGFTLEGWSHNSGSVLPDQGRYIATPTGLLHVSQLWARDMLLFVPLQVDGLWSWLLEGCLTSP